MGTSHKKINLEIEFLRGVAVLFTLVSHLPILIPHHNEELSRFFSYFMPWSGVDLFFCISGYVVSKAYIEHLDFHRTNGTFFLATQTFWLRRAFRLLPSAWFWVLAGFCLSLFFNKTGIFGSPYENIRSATAIFTFFGNLANQYGRLLYPNEVYWSLALEEQFYFLFPFFILWCPDRFRWRVLLFLIAIQFPIDRQMFGDRASALLNSFRLDAMMWGVFIYLLSKKPHYLQLEPTFMKGSRRIQLLVLLILLYCLAAIPAQIISTPTSVGLIAAISAAIVLLASYDSGYIPRIPFITPALVWLGTRSYGAYLIHCFVYRFSFEAWSRYAEFRGKTVDERYTLRLALTASVLILALSYLNFKFIEEPLRRKGARLAQARLDSYKNQPSS